MNETNPFLNKAPRTETVHAKTAMRYENNPFFIAIRGVELLFEKAKSVGIALVILAGLSIVGSIPGYYFPEPSTYREPTQIQQQQAPTTNDTTSPAMQTGTTPTTVPKDIGWEKIQHGLARIPLTVWVLVGLFILFGLMLTMGIGLVIQGVVDYTSARIAKGHHVTLSEALSGVFSHFWGYAWVQIVAGAKTFLWTLLLVIPGFVMSYRYSLAGVAFFDKELKGDKAVQHSVALTKDSWLTTFAAQSLLPMLTLGAAASLFTPGTRAVLYRQLEHLTAAHKPKPKAHIVSWLTLLVPIVLWALVALLVGIVIVAVRDYL